MFTEYVERSFLDPEYSFVAVQRILPTRFAKQKFAQLRTRFTEYSQPVSRTNIRPIKSGLYGLWVQTVLGQQSRDERPTKSCVPVVWMFRQTSKFCQLLGWVALLFAPAGFSEEKNRISHSKLYYNFGTPSKWCIKNRHKKCGSLMC